MNRLAGVLMSAGAALLVVSIGGEAEAQVCPSGYRWSGIAGRCIRSCPPGSYYSYVTGRCRRRTRYYRKCGPGRYWSHAQRRCMRYRRCGRGFYFSYSENRCKPLRRTCSFGQYYDSYARRCRSRCRPGWRWTGSRCVASRPVSRCGPGWRWSNYYRRCVRLAGHVNRTCPSGSSWNGYRCVSWRRCPPGQYYSSRFGRCRNRVSTCPYGYRYRPGWGCQRICPSGWYFSDGSCKRAARTCPSSQFYSYSLRRCVNRCRTGWYWSYRARRCKPASW